METKLLEQIVRNTAKYSKQIIVSDNKTEFITKFSPPIELDVDYEIALVDLETYYSFPNIKNNVLKVLCLNSLHNFVYLNFSLNSFEADPLELPNSW